MLGLRSLRIHATFEPYQGSISTCKGAHCLPENLFTLVSNNSVPYLIIIVFQVAEQLPPPDCKAFVAIGGKLICDIKKAVKLIESSDKM